MHRWPVFPRQRPDRGRPHGSACGRRCPVSRGAGVIVSGQCATLAVPGGAVRWAAMRVLTSAARTGCSLAANAAATPLASSTPCSVASRQRSLRSLRLRIAAARLARSRAPRPTATTHASAAKTSCAACRLPSISTSTPCRRIAGSRPPTPLTVTAARGSRTDGLWRTVTVQLTANRACESLGVPGWQGVMFTGLGVAARLFGNRKWL